MSVQQNIKLTVDAVIFSFTDSTKKVLLVKRKNEPFLGQWVFPGGFVDEGENLETAAIRELEEETSLGMDSLIQLRAYGEPGRDPRGHTVTVAYMGLVNADVATVNAGSDAEEVKWFDLSNLPQLGFDHSEILKDAIEAASK